MIGLAETAVEAELARERLGALLHLGHMDSSWATRLARPRCRAFNAAVWAPTLNIVATASFVPTGMACPPLLVDRPGHAAQSPVKAEETQGRQEVAATTQELVAALKERGMPIAAIADVLDVERKTVYSWLDDAVEANGSNYSRLNQVHMVLAENRPEHCAHSIVCGSGPCQMVSV